eukprot:CAMPEP_0171265704 /NCGR_PEP_ID=MMETSP0790-20130122/58264_1 /TAXON_ID=2925 /ORGANISM="Alexandrium catenella, Strain OF101" /LENGTH=51 /DNA_ID=CAMNT_0011734385 /DNA_START=48 /DNA_END=200 /DNA_ORIENTATION=-
MAGKTGASWAQATARTEARGCRVQQRPAAPTERAEVRGRGPKASVAIGIHG